MGQEKSIKPVASMPSALADSAGGARWLFSRWLRRSTIIQLLGQQLAAFVAKAYRSVKRLVSG